MNLGVFKEISDSALRTLVHEAAHIAEARKTKRWTHGKLWYEMFEKAIEHLGVNL